MKKTGLLHGELSKIIAELGHGQTIVIADCGLPVPPHVPMIDLSVSPGVPSLLDVLKAVGAELAIESAELTKELQHSGPEYFDTIAKQVSVPIEVVTHSDFKEHVQNACAVVRTGECTPYANVLLVAGVTF